MVTLLQEALRAETLVVAIDPGKVFNRVLLASDERGPIAMTFMPARRRR